MPSAKKLPAQITSLTEHNAIEISSTRFEHDMGRLIKGITGERQATATSSRWRWISDPNHQRTLGFIGAFIAALAAGGWQPYVHFSADSKPASTTIYRGITLKEHEESLERREQELREEFTKTSAADKERLALLEKQLAAATAKRENPEASLADFKVKLAEASQALAKFKGELPEDQLKQAQEALAKGDTAAAEEAFAKVLEQGKAQAAASNEKAAEAAYQLGELAYEHIDYKKAYAYYQEAAKLEPDDPTYLNMVGTLAHEVGRYAEARPFLEEALAIREDALGREHPHVAQSLNNLAEFYRAQGQYGKAEPLYQRALAIWEKAPGPAHLADVVTSLNNLAALYDTQGQYDKAEPLYQRALEILQLILPPDHPILAQVMGNYSTLLGKLNRDPEAKEWQVKADAARRQHADKNRSAQ